MNNIIITFIFGYLLLTSCSQDRKSNSIDESKKTVVETSDVITSKDTKDQIRAKLKLNAEQGKKEFGEVTLYDDFLQNDITKYFIKNDEGERVLTVVVYNNRLRYMKILIQHVGDTTTENKQKHLNRIKGGLQNAIKSGEFQVTDHTYLKGTENGDVWYNAFIVSESKKTGKQNYWNLMAPEADYAYLKHMTKYFQAANDFDTKFVLEK